MNNVGVFSALLTGVFCPLDSSTIVTFIPVDSIRPDPALYTQFIYFLHGLLLW